MPVSLERGGRFLLAAARRFYADQCLVRASALAYTSLLSMVPLLAVMFAVLKGLGVQDRLEALLLLRLSLSPEATEAIIGYVDRTNFGTLGGLGAALLLLTVISLLGSVESSFNHIWRVARDRTPWRKVTDYLSVVLLTPFLLLAAVALTSSMQTDRFMRWLLESPWLSELALRGLGLVPVFFNVLALGVLYAVMPNRRSSLQALVLGAVFAGVGWHVVQIAYIRFQIGVAGYNAIYGAFSQLPLTLVWLYVSWAIVLLGAEIAALWEFGWEHFERNARAADPAAVALHVLARASEAFDAGGPPVEVVATARLLRVAPETVAGVATALQERGWLAPLEGSRQRFVLAADPRRIELSALADLRTHGAIPAQADPRVSPGLARLEASERDAWSRCTLAEILGR